MANTLPTVVRGMLAGAAGTLAMTATQHLEMALSGRQPSQVPGQVAAHLLPGRDPGTPAHVQQLNAPMHWAHGITMGAVRGALDGAGLQGPSATAAHFALVWGGDATLYRTLGIADVPWKWAPEEVATDLMHKGVYAVVTGAVYDRLSDRGRSAWSAR